MVNLYPEFYNDVFGPLMQHGSSSHMAAPCRIGCLCASLLGEETAEILVEMARETPVGRNGTPEDVAKAFAYLADAEFVTGDVISVSGGYVI